MKRLDFSTLIPDKIVCHGALDFDFRPKGISPRRLPNWTRAQVPRVMDVIVRMPSGVRLVFDTDATEISVTALATNLVTPPAVKRPVVMDLNCEGMTHSVANLEGNTIYLDRHDPSKVDLVRGEAAEWRFGGLPGHMKRCEIWLPQNAMVELRHLSLSNNATLAMPATESRPKWIHYGSSISHCMEADQPSLTWPAVAAAQLDWSLQSLGFGGQCHLDPFVARTMAQSDADILSIKAGINIINMDSMRERIFGPLLHGFLDTLREHKPDAPIILMSPIYCPSAEQHPGPTVADHSGKFVIVTGHQEVRKESLTLARIRALMNELVLSRQDPNLHYIDGLSIFGEADAWDLPDDLHPNPAGYIRMGERFAVLAAELPLSARPS
ncbi:MAG: hypothetical protein ACJAYE_002321 [Candidatus Azotimanducaceae bacterium]|jgi:hypothetical protein